MGKLVTGFCGSTSSYTASDDTVGSPDAEISVVVGVVLFLLCSISNPVSNPLKYPSTATTRIATMIPAIPAELSDCTRAVAIKKKRSKTIENSTENGYFKQKLQWNPS